MVEYGIQLALIQWLGIVSPRVAHCRILEPIPRSHEMVLGDSQVRHGCLGNRMARLRYWVAGAHVYRHPQDVGDHLR